MPTGADRFQIALTADFYAADGSPRYRDLGLSVLAAVEGIAYRPLADFRPELAADQLAGVQGVIVMTPRVTAASVSQARDLLAVGRFGVGYDGVDVPACTAADVAVFITAGAVDRSVAEATICWMLALTHHVRVKDRLVRTGEWERRSAYMGCELRGRTLGVIGFGGIGQSVVQLLSGFGMNTPLVYDPFVDPAVAERLGVRSVGLDELLASSDFVSLHCPLNQHTRGLLGPAQLRLMKPGSYLINTARGGIVDEDALYDAVVAGRIAGAALDCFVDEPVTQPHRFRDLDQVLLAPHSIAWTEELFRDIGRTVCQGMVDMAGGRRPRGVVNPEVFERPGFLAKWERLRLGAAGEPHPGATDPARPRRS